MLFTVLVIRLRGSLVDLQHHFSVSNYTFDDNNVSLHQFFRKMKDHNSDHELVSFQQITDLVVGQIHVTCE